ncbi:MAG TPA: ABC transporter permease [Flavisolibacter sp.]|nr:ABC transporter permease [Flavisolibacter sp.]
MFTTYFKLAWRNLVKNKAFSLINIAGLTIGMACTLLILVWVYNERSWDKNNKHYENIYHVMCNRDFNGEINTGQDMMYPLPKAAKASFPEIEHAAIVSFGENTLFTVGDKRLNKSTLTVSPDFFDIFSYEPLQGNLSTAVKDADAVILTESTAKALFGNVNVINQPVEINNHRTAYVKAVIKDAPRNSTLQFEGIIPFNPSSPDIVKSETEWVNCGNRVFFQTHSGANIPALASKVLNLVKEHTEGENPTTRGSIILHPMSKWRLYGDFSNGVNTGGRIEYVNLFTWIAVIILIIACVNFMNLSTARSEKRAKEVGIRKTLGSERKQLLYQFISESLLLSLLAFVFAAAIVMAVVPAFSQLLKEDLVIPFYQPITWTLVVMMILFTGLVAGSYPAFYLSGFNPIKVLKGTFLPGKQALLPRKILVTFQFIASIILISATVVIYKQLQYVKDRDLGYDQDNLVMVNSTPETDKSFDALKNDLLQTGLVASVNRTSSPITDIYMSTSGIRWVGAPPSSNLVIGFIFTSEDFAQTVHTKVLEGRDFRAGDSNSIVFNKEAIRLMGLKNPVGTKITWAGKDRTIVGVIDDMVITSPYKPADPLMLVYENKWSGRINLRLAKNADLKNALAAVEKTYKKYSIEYPFEYKFIDEEFNRKFINEQLIGKLSVIFAGLAIFICCLGLFGLVASSIERRRKEIGIRKVLGATMQQLLLLMSKEFLWLVALAFVVAIPIAWWGMNKWLQNYSYRTDISVGVFAMVGIVILFIALLTVSLNASRAALSNPVKTLRSE